MASDITFFTDETVACEGAITPGPSMAEWARLVDPGSLPTNELGLEARAVTPITFPTRRLGGEYLGWAFRTVVEGLPDAIEGVVHVASALDITEDRDASGELGQVVHLDNVTSPL